MINQQGAVSVRVLFMLPVLALVAVPFLGYQHIQDTSEQMIAFASERQQANVEQIRDLIASNPSWIDEGFLSPSALYATPVRTDIQIDGQEDDWANIPAQSFGKAELVQINRTFEESSLSALLQIQRNETHTYLLLTVFDDAVVYREISHISIHRNDHVRFAMSDSSDNLQRYTLATEQPGNTFARVVTTGGRALRIEPKIEAFWRATDEGYVIEAKIDNSLLGSRFSFNIADVDDFETRDIQYLLGNQFTDSAKELGYITGPSSQLEAELKRLGFANISLFDSRGNLIAGDIDSNIDRTLRTTLYRADEVIAIVEAGVDQTLSTAYRTDAITQLAISSLLLLLCGFLLAHLAAGRLLSRLSRMGNELEAVVDNQGRVLKTLVPPDGGDELSDLTRRFSSITSRLQQYNEYLENLSRRLAHELRTPVSVVRSSLEHLQQKVTDDDQRFVERATNGVTRLTSILNSMSEAARLEENFDKDDVIVFNLADVLSGCVEGYQNAFGEQLFELNIETNDVKVTGIPELFAQLLDKLVDNAVQFSIEDQPVVIRLSQEEETAIVRISNSGPALPAQMADELFEPMISMRGEQHREDSHLGLGLHVAKLIATFHGGTVTLTDREDREGVVASVRLPLMRLTSKLM